MSSEGRNWELFIQDMLRAIGRIQERTTSQTFERFAADQDGLEIVAWNFQVLGEASTHVPAEIMDAHPEVPWTDMRAMRNQLVHGYYHLNPKILWDTATVEVPTLLGPLLELVKQDGDGLDESPS